MTLVEFMIGHSPHRIIDARRDRQAGGRWLGWFTRAFGWLEGQSDWNRKV